MYRYLVILFFSIASFNMQGQVNLVPNPSFEDKDSCPSCCYGITRYCTEWFDPVIYTSPPPPYPIYNSYDSSGGVAYYHTCGQDYHISVPSNSYGFQWPRTGDAYVGVLLLSQDNDLAHYIEFHNYMSVQLMGELVKDNYYCAEIYYSITSLTPGITEPDFEKWFRFIDIGMLFTDSMVVPEPGIGTGQPQNIYANPQVSYRIPAIDTLNWLKVEGVFKAKGGEKFLTIGSFEKYDTLTGDVYVLLFFDDVSVKHCGYDTVYPPDSLQIPNVFTPNGDGYNDKFEYKNQEQWDFETQVFNRWGGVVYENASSQNWDGRYKGELVSEGVYFYVIKARAKTTGEERLYKGTVSVFYN